MDVDYYLGIGITDLTGHNRVEGLVSRALAVNGVASVIAAPLAVLVSSTFGFVVLLSGAAVCYAGASLIAWGSGRADV